VYKANKGFCDLQFSNCSRDELLAMVKSYLSDRMTVEKAGKSASVRIAVPPVWFEHSFDDHIVDVKQALDAIQELNQLARTLAKYVLFQ
jgi:site-specific recombinase XerC